MIKAANDNVVIKAIDSADLYPTQYLMFFRMNQSTIQRADTNVVWRKLMIAMSEVIPCPCAEAFFSLPKCTLPVIVVSIQSSYVTKSEAGSIVSSQSQPRVGSGGFAGVQRLDPLPEPERDAEPHVELPEQLPVG